MCIHYFIYKLPGQALNTETAAVIGTMMAMEVVVNQDTYKDKLEVSRRVCAFLTKKLGMSKNDLTPLLKTKFDSVANSASTQILYFNF